MAVLFLTLRLFLDARSVLQLFLFHVRMFFVAVFLPHGSFCVFFFIKLRLFPWVVFFYGTLQVYPAPMSTAQQHPKCAVRGLSLGIKRGECFGLLGKPAKLYRHTFIIRFCPAVWSMLFLAGYREVRVMVADVVGFGLLLRLLPVCSLSRGPALPSRTS